MYQRVKVAVLDIKNRIGTITNYTVDNGAELEQVDMCILTECSLKMEHGRRNFKTCKCW